jgi:hypothetical protein
MPGLATALAGAFLLGVLSAVPNAATTPVHIGTRLVASGPWLDRLNAWRANAGLPSLTENSLWSAGDYDHAVYMVKNDLVTHYETSGTPYYTAAGDAAARSGNIQVSSTTNTSDVQAIDWWMAAPFHAMGMMDPRLTQTGFGSYREVKSGWQTGFALDTIRGNSFSGGTYPVYFPGNGTSEPLTTYGGNEFPDPLQACPGYSAPAGLPVFIEVGGNVNTTAGAVHSFTGNGVPLTHCVIDSSNSALSSYLYSRGGVILIPQQPLQNGVRYVVALTVNGVPYTWSFSVGPSLSPQLAVTEVLPHGGPVTGGTAATITGRGFTGTTAVKFGTSPASAFTVVNDTTITAVSPAHAVGTVDVTVTGPGGTSASSQFDQFSFGACTSATMSPPAGSSFAAGGTVAFTAGASGCPTPEFEFWVLPPGSYWQMGQAYSPSPNFSWNTSGLAPGGYQVVVWVRQHGDGNATYDVGAGGNYTLASAGACTSATISPPAGSSFAAGSTIAYTAGAGGCPSPEFEFWTLAPGSYWIMGQAYSPSPTFSWITSGLATGGYQVVVWVRQHGDGTPTYDVGAGGNYTLTSAGACTSATMSPPAGSSFSVASTVAFTAGAGGCPSPEFEFWVLPPGSYWQMLRAYGASPNFSWNTTGLIPGGYQVVVWVRQRGSGTATYEAGAGGNYTLTGCASATMSPPAPSTFARGSAVAFTAGAGGCTSPEFEFWVLAPGSYWIMGRAYSASPNFSWNTTGLAPGGYQVVVWVRQQGSGTATYEAGAGGNYTLT